MVDEEDMDVPTSSNFSDEYRPVRPSSSADSTKRKIVIKNFKSHPVIPEISEVSEWHTINESIEAILENKKVITSLETLFNLVKSSTDQNHPKALYDRLLGVIREYCIQLKTTIELENDIPMSEDTCEVYILRFWNVWKVYPVKMTLIRNVFLYLDRVLLSQTGDSDILPIWEASMRMFRRVFFPDIENDFKSHKLFLALFLDIQRMMKHYDAQGIALREIFGMFSAIHMNDEFMEYLVLQINDTYSNKNLDLPCKDYIKYADNVIKQFRELVDLYFCEPSASRVVFEALLKCLISKSIKQIVLNGFDQLLDSDEISDVSRMFQLVRRVNGGEDIVRNEFAKYIKAKGQQHMETCSDKDFFKQLSLFKKRIDLIVEVGFVSSIDINKLRQTVRDSFESFMDSKGNKSAELIARHFNETLRKSKEYKEEDIDDAIVLFRFIRGKDIFEAYYKRDLAKRLLSDKSASVDAEKSILTKLKLECGAGFTHKLEGMFKDMENSAQLNNSFAQHLSDLTNTPKEKLKYYVRVITSDLWPNYDLYEVNLPREIETSLVDFSDYYKLKHGNRTINWIYSLSHAYVFARVRPGYVKEFLVNFSQTSVLLLFNSCEKWTFNEMLNATKLPKDELKKTILALHGSEAENSKQTRIINALCENGDINSKTTSDNVEKHSFVFNSKLTDSRYRIPVLNVYLKTPKEEKEQVEQEVNQDRQYQIDAAIVRIMKSRKELTHSALIQEIMAQLRFPVKSVDIKLRIASLIERDYLSRDQEDTNKYHYVS
ncbi:unnamed protein product [Caenorhabditis angaria]|uniref:Cullin family profile domain-containing protein n=1 Tax=Caenorhabditis angaria TaxID=860376 RepID=A0A9P1MW36_9PELO|nr:unnamed protein product [Caenorhabditis angaria]